jgi:hypothetical protein
MTVEELKAKLVSGEEEGADRAAIYDEVLADVSARDSEMLAKVEEKEAKIADLSAKLAELTETNLKLLEKVKYAEDVTDDVIDETDEAEAITIADLFEEED